MGCDIHMHTEIKVKGKWIHWNQPRIDRSYQLFGLLAGVRQKPDEQISEPRGLPKDISETIKIHADYWEGDGHSHSWINSKEASWIIDKYFKPSSENMFEHDGFGYLFGYGWEIEYQEEWPDNVEDYRWVFWFDY